MIRLYLASTSLIAVLLGTILTAQAGFTTPITKALPAVQSVGMAPKLKIVFTQPQSQGETDPAEDWPGDDDECCSDPPSPPGSGDLPDDPADDQSDPSDPAEDRP